MFLTILPQILSSSLITVVRNHSYSKNSFHLKLSSRLTAMYAISLTWGLGRG